MTNHSYNPSLVLKVVFHPSPSQLLIWWQPLFKSILVNYFDPIWQSIKSSIMGKGNLCRIVILLMALESLHILHSPSFFQLNIVGTKHGIKISLISPLSNNFWTWFLNSSFSIETKHTCKKLQYLIHFSFWFLFPGLKFIKCPQMHLWSKMKLVITQ